MPMLPSRPHLRLAPGLATILITLALLSGCQQAVPPAGAPTEAPASVASVDPALPPAAASPNLPIDLNAVSGDRALAHVRQLAGTIGIRPTGTPQEKAAADYIAGQLQSYGYQVEEQPFEFPWQEDQSALAMQGGDRIAAGKVVRSKEGVVSGALADAGDASSLAENSLSGKIALAERGGTTFEDKATQAAKAGASALVIFNSRAGTFSGLMQHDSSIPVIAIAREDGLKLRDRLQHGPVQVEVTVQTQKTTIKSQNVVGRSAGRCAVVVGGHYDSVTAGPGANDNASGTAVMLEAAQVAAPAAAARGLCFVAFGGEELGLFGSQAFVQQLDGDERNFMLGMVNLDMEGVGDSWRATGDDKLVSLGLDAAKRIGLEAGHFDLPRGTGSDFESFQQANIPTVYPALLDDPLFHTPQDTVDRVLAEHLRDAARWTLAIVEDLTT